MTKQHENRKTPLSLHAIAWNQRVTSVFVPEGLKVDQFIGLRSNGAAVFKSSDILYTLPESDLLRKIGVFENPAEKMESTYRENSLNQLITARNAIEEFKINPAYSPRITVLIKLGEQAILDFERSRKLSGCEY